MIIDNKKKKYTKVSEYAKEMPQSRNADQPTTPKERKTERKQPHDIERPIKVKQPDTKYCITKPGHVLVSLKKQKHSGFEF